MSAKKKPVQRKKPRSSTNGREVWRYVFAIVGKPQIVGGWGLWLTRGEAAKELRSVKRRDIYGYADSFEVRRVPCKVVSPHDYTSPRRSDR